MKSLIKKLSVISIITLFVASFISAATVDKEATFKVGSSDILDVTLRQGNVTINTSTNNEVKVFAKKIDDDEAGLLTMEQKGGKVDIQFKGEDSDDFELELTIPAGLTIDIKTGGGNVTVNNDLNGKIDITSAGGNISVKNINGLADISTGGGNINLGDINNNADVSSAGGDIVIGSVNGKADISTGGGNIKVGTVTSSADISSAGGNINVESVDGMADISTGGGNINVGVVSGNADISTGGGNINLEGATGQVETSTGAGNINLKNIKGSVDISTGAGNITVELYPDGKNRSDISSGIGDVTLYVPSDAKVTIIASVNDFSWGESKDVPENINSDFELTTYDKEGHGSDAVYQLNGGGSVIELNATMGEINIKKLK
ncbi:MAG TPA: hypothetical protein VH917_00495 [Ignavibacteriaceae bacterium]|jgi:hypothetical protein